MSLVMTLISVVLPAPFLPSDKAIDLTFSKVRFTLSELDVGRNV